MTDISKPIVDDRIPTACATLDEMLTTPRWDELINLRRLELASPTACVLGQTGRKRDIPGDGSVPWDTYNGGRWKLRHWLDEHPTAAEAIGTNWDKLDRVFGGNIPEVRVKNTWISQNTQWRRWIQYRQALRAAAAVETTDVTAD